MGQRLNLEITYGNKVLANAYYHWSGYSHSAACLTADAIDRYDEMELDYEKIESRHLCERENYLKSIAIQMLEYTEAGVNDDEQKRISETTQFQNFQINQCTDRNTGLLSITKEGIAETERYEEARVTIDLRDEVVLFGVCWSFCKSEYIRDLMESDEITYEEAEEDYESIPEIEYDLNQLSFEDVCYLPDYIENHGSVVDDDGYVVRWIE